MKDYYVRVPVRGYHEYRVEGARSAEEARKAAAWYELGTGDAPRLDVHIDLFDVDVDPCIDARPDDLEVVTS